MHRDKVSPQRMHAACRIITRGSCCTKSSALRSSTTTVKAVVVWNSWSRRYALHTRENLLPVRIIRIQKAPPEDTCCTDHQVCCIVGGALGLE